MTRLAEVKLELAEANKRASLFMEALHLALTTKPDAIEKFKTPDNAGRYEVSAYGLMRASGGVVIIKFIHEGQNDTISAVSFDDFRNDYREAAAVTPSALPFALAAHHFAIRQQKGRCSEKLDGLRCEGEADHGPVNSEGYVHHYAGTAGWMTRQKTS